MMIPHSPKPTILVIEDEAGPRDALKVILRPFFNIQVAENGQVAMRLLKELPVDLVTLDQRLPGRQGLDLLQDIKLEHGDVEVIIITGYGSLKSAMEGIRHGAAGYLLKPFNVTELITLINQTLEKKQRLDCLRTFLKHPGELAAAERESEQAWKGLSAQYSSLTKAKQESDPRFAASTGLIPLLSDLLEAKDRQLFNHSSRVSFYSTLLANRLNLSLSEQKSLALGAFLHDIGKIAMEDHFLSKTEGQETAGQDRLTRHPEIGARMILPLGLPAEVGQIISYHHERYDGTGYPYGLQGEGIPLLARIVSIAQTFDHLITDHPTPQALPIEAAIQQITLQADTRFDPMLTDVFARVINECKASLPALAMSARPMPIPEL
jgi:putative nucleotidyltransferase with HDIG domain